MIGLTTRLIDITSETLGIERTFVSRTSRFVEDLGADSVDCVELMMVLEDAFEIEVADADVLDLTTVDAVATYLRIRASNKPTVRSLLAV